MSEQSTAHHHQRGDDRIRARPLSPSIIAVNPSPETQGKDAGLAAASHGGTGFGNEDLCIRAGERGSAHAVARLASRSSLMPALPRLSESVFCATGVSMVHSRADFAVHAV